MDKNQILAKITASPTDNTWSQAYSTLNLYIVMSIQGEMDDITATGKEIFEKIQREYFSLDNKTLKNIKGSIENSVGEFFENKKISLTLATTQNDILYIVTAGHAEAAIKRGDKIGIVARGEDKNIIAFSGKLLPDDIVIIETGDFTNKVSSENLIDALSANEITDISDAISPIIHADPKGTEAALILKYKAENNQTPNLSPTTSNLSNEEIEHDENHEKSQKKRQLNFKIPSISLYLAGLRTGGKKKFITIAIVFLIILLAGSIYLENQRQTNASANAALAEILTPAEADFQESQSLLNLNKTLALDGFKKLKETLEEERDKFKEGSEQLARLDEFIAKVDNEINKLTQGTTIENQKTLHDDSGLSIYRDNRLISVNKNGAVNILNADGDSEDEFETNNGNPTGITANDSFIYILGDNGITRTNISNKNTTEAVENVGDTVSIDLFGSNIYGLNTDTNSIDRYSGSSFSRGDYLNNETLINPTSMTIDGSIWVIDDGKILKFTRGSASNFSVSNLALSQNSIIFTSADYNNLYIVDKNASVVYIISKNGNIENQYSWTTLSDTTSISADENNKTIYISANNTLYSFSFE